MTRQRSRNYGPALLAMATLGFAAGCSDSPTSNSNEPISNPQMLTAPAAQGELWACKFSVDPVTKLPNGDVVSISTRYDGTQIITTKDLYGHIKRRVRRDANGTEYVLIGFGSDYNQPAPSGGQYQYRIAPTIIAAPRNPYVVDYGQSSQYDVEAALEAPPLVPVDRVHGYLV